MVGRKQQKPILNVYHNSHANISRNRHLHITPSPAQDLVLAENYTKESPKTFSINGDSMGESVCSHTQGMTEPPNHCIHMEPSERQQWGSDLELASPIITEMLNLPSLTSGTNEATMVISGGGSSTLSSLRIHNLEPSLWRQATMLPNSSPSLVNGVPQNIGVATRSTGANCREENGISVDMKDLDLAEDGDREKEKGIRNFRPAITGRNSENVELSFNMLSQFFDMPIDEASKKLKVGHGVLKRRCRFYGIPWWPHGKVKDINSFVLDVQQEFAKQDVADDGIQGQDAMKELEKQMSDSRMIL